MTFVPRFSRLLPSFLWRPAVFLAAIAQLSVGFAPLAEIREGTNAHAHVEANGVGLHHAHDESTCIVSIAQHLLAGAVPGTPRSGIHVGAAASVVDLSRDVAESSLTASTRSRAPPGSGVTG